MPINEDLAMWGFVLFGVVPLLLALTSGVWFWKLPHLGKLWQRKTEWDPAQLSLPEKELTLKRLRETDSIGSKTTVAHHLALWADEIRVRLINTQVRAFATTLIGYGLIAASHASTQSVGKSTPSQIFLELLAVYTLPVGAFIFLFEAYALITSVIDQARKFEDVLDPAAAQRRK